MVLSLKEVIFAYVPLNQSSYGSDVCIIVIWVQSSVFAVTFCQQLKEMTLLCSGIWGRYEVCCLSNECLLTGILSSSMWLWELFPLCEVLQCYHILFISYNSFHFCLCILKMWRFVKVLNFASLLTLEIRTCAFTLCGMPFTCWVISPVQIICLIGNTWAETEYSGMFQNSSFAGKLFLEEKLTKAHPHGSMDGSP